MYTLIKFFFSTLLIFFLSTSYANELGELILSHPTRGSQTVVYEKVNGYAVAEGDILLAKIRDVHRKGAMILTPMGGKRWPRGVVPFAINSNLPFMNKLAIMQAINIWQTKSSIRFIELTPKNRLYYPSYISFVPAPGRICSSFVGRQGGRQEIQLSPRCETMNTVHEIGHALGLWHEQSRADRDNYVRILWENIEEDHKYNFNQHLTDGIDFGEYDYQSLMHYAPYAFSRNGQPTIIPLVAGVTIGQRVELSAKDLAAVRAMYPESN